PTAPQNGPAAERAGRLLKDLFADATAGREKIAIPCKHEYTEASLSPAQLKGADRARFDVLRQAAEAIDYQIYLALVTHHQTGDVDYETYNPPPRGRWGWGGEEDYEDDDVDMGEVFEEDITVNHFCGADGQTRDFGELHLDDNEILGGDDRDGWSMRQ